jgi:hypothetical protein
MADTPPADAPAAPAPPDWDSVVGNFMSDRQGQANGNLTAAQGVDPDKAAAARVLAPVLNIPAAAMEDDPKFWQDQFTQRTNRATVGTDANLASWLAATPDNAKLASDDIQNLGVIGRFARGFNEATLQSQANQIEASEGAHIASPMQMDFLQTLKEQLGQYQDADAAAAALAPAYTGPRASRQSMLGPPPATPGQNPSPTIGDFAQGAGGFASGVVNTAPEVVVGAGTGAALGSLAGGVGAVPVAIGGAGLGLVTGFAGQTAVDTYGQTYDTLANVTDKQGKPVSEITRQSAALVAAGLSGALATVGGGELSPFIRDVATEAATRPALSAALGQFAKSTIKSGLTGAFVNGGMGLVQTLAPQVAEAVTSPDFQTVFNDPAQRAALVTQTVDQMEQGAALFGSLHVPMAGVSLLADAARADAATRALQSWQGMQSAAAGSKLRNRAPDAFSALMDTYNGGGSIFVPGERLQDLYQGIQSHPGAPNDPFAFVPDIEAQMSRASLTGGDVEIPISDFTAHLAGTPIEQQLRPDIRFNEDGMTMREALDFDAQTAGHQFEPIDLSQTQHMQDVEDVKQDVLDQARNVGMTADHAEQVATLVSERYGARGARLGQSPLELYKSEGIQMTRDPGVVAGPAQYTGIDEAIDALRRGDIGPTDKQLYGDSLVDFLTKRGGIKDDGGELAALGVKGKLINPKGMSLDEAVAAAFQPGAFDKAGQGYFPDHTEDRPPDRNDLLDAIQGGPRYLTPSTDTLKKAQFRDTVRQLDQFLNERGIDIKTASNLDIKTALDQTLNQPDGAAGARGSISMGEGRRIITLFRDADRSTILHELGHQWLDEALRDAEREDAPHEMRDDAATLRKWLGLKDGEKASVEAHEKFAQGFEQYLMEGKAPSSALRLAFQKFALWLTRIYRTMAGLGAPINDRVRGVMDRLLATDDAIEDARSGLAIKNPLFRTPEEAGMTVGEFAAYTGMMRKAESAQYERVLRRALRVEEMKRKAEWKQAQDEARPGIEKQVKSRPVLQAWKLLASGKDILDPSKDVMGGKLSLAAVKEILGPAYARFPRGLTAEDGMHPDTLAPALSYASGEDMLRDLVNENVGRENAAMQLGKKLGFDAYVSRLVDQALDQHLEERFGDPLQDGTLEEAAAQAAHNESQRDVIAAEMRQLAKQVGAKPPYSIKQVEAWAKSNLAETAMNKATRVGMYRRAEAKAGRDAERALLRKNPVEAFKAKQRQMIAHAFATEAQRLQDTWQKTTTYWRNVARQPTRAGTAQPFLDQVHGILDRLGVPVKRDAGELARGLKGKPLDGFVRDQAAAGYDLYVPDFLRDGTFKGFYGELTADQFEGVRDAVTSLLTAGRAQEQVTLDGKRVALADLVDEAVDRMMALPDRAQSNRLRPDRILDVRDVRGAMHAMATFGRQVDASLLKIEQMFSQLDGDTRGPFLRLFDRLKEAEHAEKDRLEGIAGDWRAMKATMPPGWAKSLRQRMTIPELINPDTGKPFEMDRNELIGMALNVGNTGPTSNFEKLIKGFGWDGDIVMRVLRQRMTKADWDFVQGVWDIFEKMTPDIEEMHRRVTGVGFPRVEVNPIETPHGIYRGGYFPVIYDAGRAKTAKGAEAGLFEPTFYRATTSKGHTIGRVEYSAPLKLGLDQIPYKISQVVHDLTHREAIMDAWKFLNRPEITGAVKQKMGPEYAGLFNPWLRDLANNANTDDKSLQWMDNAIRRVRLGTSAVQIGFRATTVLKHSLSALSNSIGEVGGPQLIRASRDVYGPNGKAMRDMILEKSGEMRHRMENIDRDARESLKALMGEAGWIQQVQRLGFYPVAAMDMGTAVPTWLAGYRRALEGGAGDDEAVKAADRTVRFAHGSAGAADLSAIQRGAEWQKALTMFYGFFNHMYNRERATVVLGKRAVRSAKAGDYVGARRDFVAVAGRSLYYLLVPAMVESMVSGTTSPEQEGYFEWGAKAIVGQVAAGIPLVRDLATSALEGYSYEVTPLQQPVEEAATSAADLAKVVGLDQGQVSAKWLQHAIDTVGYATGLPAGQAGTAAQYLWDIGNGEADPQNLGDFLHGLMHGVPMQH